MKCPTCERFGYPSKVYPDGWSSVTAMGISEWWDETGQLHVHDPNARGQGYRCSNRHRWHQSWLLKCPTGDYGGDVQVQELGADLRESIVTWSADDGIIGPFYGPAN